MKLILLAMLLPIFCFSAGKENNFSGIQSIYRDSIPETAFLLKNQQLVFQKVFHVNLSKEKLAEKINTLLSITPGFHFENPCYTSEGEFVGRIFQHKFDMVRYGATVFGTPTVLTYPINATVVVQIKDYKYRVTILDITFKEVKKDDGDEVNILLVDYLTQKNRNSINASKSNLRLARDLNLDFIDLFDFNKSVISNDF